MRLFGGDDFFVTDNWLEGLAGEGYLPNIGNLAPLRRCLNQSWRLYLRWRFLDAERYGGDFSHPGRASAKGGEG
jgi:hypothetical protein